MGVFSAVGVSALMVVYFLVQQGYGLSLQVSTEGGNASSALLYGFMFEVCILQSLFASIF